MEIYGGIRRDSSESEQGWISKAGFRWKSMEEDHRKSIYICSVAGEIQWHVIPSEDLFTSSSSSPPSPLPPAPIPTLPGTEHCTSVFLHPKIYLIGGGIDSSLSQRVAGLPSPESTALGRRVYSYDVTKGGVWQKMKDMDSPRMSPCAFALDGKLFVFGGVSCACCLGMTDPIGSNCYATKPFLEIYDPLTDTWEGRLHGGAVSLSPLTSRVSALFEDCCGYRHVLFHTGGHFLWTYNMDLDLVASRDEDFDFSGRGPSAVVDGILFCGDQSGQVIGYDLTSSNSEWCGVFVSGLTAGREIPNDEDWLPVCLLSIGGNRLCIMYPDGDVMFCSVVRVMRTAIGGLHAVVESFKTYSYHGSSFGFSVDCFAL